MPAGFFLAPFGDVTAIGWVCDYLVNLRYARV
jgi:hypothetical protein